MLWYRLKDKYLRKRGNFKHVISSCQSYTTSFMFTSEIKPSRIWNYADEDMDILKSDTLWFYFCVTYV